MANQRQSFRFRFPWFGQQNPVPQSRPTRPTQETRTPAQMTAAVAGQRPAFRPAGIAPTQPPPSQPSKTEPQDQPASQPPSASRAPTESPVTSQPPSASRAPKESRTTSQPPSPSRSPKASRATSQPPSPSRAATGSRATSQPPSPSRAPTESRATSQPSSPSRPKTQTQTRGASQLPSPPSRAAPQSRASSDSPSKSPAVSKQPQPDSETVSSQPQSPTRLASESVRGTTSWQATSPSRLQPKAGVASETPVADKDGSQSASVSSQREEKKVAESQPPLQQQQQPQMKMEIASEKTQVAKNESPMKTTSQAENGEKGAAQASDTVATPSPSQEEDKAAVSQPALQESQPKMEIMPEKTSNNSPLKTTEATKTAAISSSKQVAEAIGSGQKSDILNANGRHLSEMEGESKPESAEEGKKTVEEIPKEEKTKSPAAYEEPVQKTITEHIPTATGRRKHTRDPENVAFREEKWPQKKETSDNKVAITSYIGKQIKTVSSSGNTSNTSFQKPFSSADEQASRQKEIKEDISKLVHKLSTGHQLVESPLTVITLTGENRGASMNVSSEPAKKEESIHIHRGYKLNPDDSAEATTDGEVNNAQGRRLKDHLSKEAPPIKAYANSNVQTINNSLVFNASVNQRNPGIHLEFSQDDAEHTMINRRSESLQAHRAEFSITPSEKLTHEHTVKRRCLRGLFLDSSDSEPDNPEKPRRHGCRYGCFENKKDKELGA